MRALLRILRAVLGFCGLCRHDHRMKSLDGVGILWLVCDACGDRVQAIARTPAELRKMRKQFKVARPSTAKRPPATVTSIRTSKKRSQAS